MKKRKQKMCFPHNVGVNANRYGLQDPQKHLFLNAPDCPSEVEMVGFLLNMDRDTIFKMIPIGLSAFALLISILSYFRSKQPLNDRKLVLYARCNAIYHDLQIFSSDYLNMDLWEGERFVYFQIETEAWEEYRIEKEEFVELAIMDIRTSRYGMKMVGLPHRLNRWYLGKAFDFKTYQDNWYAYSGKKFFEIDDHVLELQGDLNKVMKYLEREFSLLNRLSIKKNSILSSLARKRSEKAHKKKVAAGWKRNSDEDIKRWEEEKRMKLYRNAQRDSHL